MRTGARSGAAAVELAVCLPVLLMMMAAITDLGLALFGLSRLTAAVAAGAQYATLKGRDVSATAIKTLVETATDASTATVDTTRCYCVEVTDTEPRLAVKGCGDSCGGTAKPVRFASISATYTYRPLTPAVKYTLPGSFTVGAIVPLR